MYIEYIVSKVINLDKAFHWIVNVITRIVNVITRMIVRTNCCMSSHFIIDAIDAKRMNFKSYHMEILVWQIMMTSFLLIYVFLLTLSCYCIFIMCTYML